MKGREPKKQGGRGSGKDDGAGVGRGRGLVPAGSSAQPAPSNPGPNSSGKGLGRGRGMGAAVADSGGGRGVNVDLYGRTVATPKVDSPGSQAPRKVGAQGAQRERPAARTNTEGARNETKACAVAPPVGGLVDDQEDERTAVYEAKYYEEGTWYPAALVHQTAKGFMVRFYGYEDDPDQDTAHADIRKILIDVAVIVSGNNAEQRCELQVGRDTTLAQLQQAVEQATKVPSSKQRLFWQGKALTDLSSKVFRECSVKEGVTMHLMIRSEQDEDMPSLAARPSLPAPTPKLAATKGTGAAPKSAAGEKKGKKAVKKKEESKNWWSRLEGDDVISLEPLGSLVRTPRSSARIPSHDRH
eukprot:884490-Rhodomonas_salina.2